MHELSLSPSRAELLLQSITDYAIYMLDPQGIVSSWNVGAERLKGYRPEEIIGEHFSRFYPPEELARGVPALALSTAAETGRFADNVVHFGRVLRRAGLKLPRETRWLSREERALIQLLESGPSAARFLAA